MFELEFQSVDVDVGRGWVCKWVKPQLGGAQACRESFSEITFTFSHFTDAFIQSDLQLGNT